MPHLLPLEASAMAKLANSNGNTAKTVIFFLHGKKTMFEFVLNELWFTAFKVLQIVARLVVGLLSLFASKCNVTR